MWGVKACHLFTVVPLCDAASVPLSVPLAGSRDVVTAGVSKATWSAKSSHASAITRRQPLSSGLSVLWARSSNEAADCRYSSALPMGLRLQHVKRHFSLQRYPLKGVPHLRQN